MRTSVAVEIRSTIQNITVQINTEFYNTTAIQNVVSWSDLGQRCTDDLFRRRGVTSSEASHTCDIIVSPTNEINLPNPYNLYKNID